MNIFGICAFALAAIGVISTIKHLNPQLANLATAAAGILIFIYVIESLSPFVAFVGSVSAESGVEGYFKIMLKALAISLCCRMTSEICRDCGENALASRVELAGKAGILLLSMPIIQQLLILAKDMLG